MNLEYAGRARKFWLADPHRWATAEEIPPDDREPNYRYWAAVYRYNAALANVLTVEVNGRTYPRSAFIGDEA